MPTTKKAAVDWMLATSCLKFRPKNSMTIQRNPISSRRNAVISSGWRGAALANTSGSSHSIR